MNKKVLIEKIKVMMKEEGKGHLLEFAEDIVSMIYKIIKIVVEETETKMDDVVLAAIDGLIKDAIDKIDKK